MGAPHNHMFADKIKNVPQEIDRFWIHMYPYMCLKKKKKWIKEPKL